MPHARPQRAEGAAAAKGWVEPWEVVGALFRAVRPREYEGRAR
jgi:hypothetical protein